MKHAHLLMVVLTLGLFGYSTVMILTQKPLTKTYQIISHIVYLLVAITGLYLLFILSQVAGVQHWVYAKIILLVVAISALIKARRRPNHKITGIAISWISLAGILGLAVLKPVLGL